MSTTYPPETVNDVVTSWIPFTTGWADIPYCHSHFILYKGRAFRTGITSNHPIYYLDVTYSAYIAYDPLWGMTMIYPRVQCLPKEVITWRSQLYYGEDGDWGQHVKLVGPSMSLLPLICPDAWSTVATFIKLSISTQVMCCPPAYWYSNSKLFSTGVEGICISTVNSGAEILYADSDTMAESFGVVGPDTTSFAESLGVVGSNTPSFAVSVVIFDPDTTSFASDITVQAVPIVGWNVHSTAFSTSNPNNIFTPFSTQPPSSSAANGYQMSNAAKIGIGVSAGVGMLIVFAFIACTVILRRRNQKLLAKIEISKESQVRPNGTDSNGVFNLPQLCEHCNSRSHELNHGNMRELGGSQIHELNHRSLRELDSVAFPFELSVATPKTSAAR